MGWHTCKVPALQAQSPEFKPQAPPKKKKKKRKVHRTPSQSRKAGCGDVHLSLQLGRKHEPEDCSPGINCKTLFKKISKAKKTGGME
jgi:hypothetical protein